MLTNYVVGVQCCCQGCRVTIMLICLGFTLCVDWLWLGGFVLRYEIGIRCEDEHISLLTCFPDLHGISCLVDKYQSPECSEAWQQHMQLVYGCLKLGLDYRS